MKQVHANEKKEFEEMKLFWQSMVAPQYLDEIVAENIKYKKDNIYKANVGKEWLALYKAQKVEKVKKKATKEKANKVKKKATRRRRST